MVRSSPRSRSAEPLKQVGNAVITVVARADAIRTVRTALMDLAFQISSEPRVHGYLVLEDSAITEERIRAEWERAAAVLQGAVVSRLRICLVRDGRVIVVPQGEAPEAAAAILKERATSRGNDAARPTRPDYRFVILKLLLHQWLVSSDPVTSDWLGRTAGCSYPTVARTLKDLGSVIERSSDRRVRLRYFPQEEFDRLVANAAGAGARNTVRFVDRSGQPRTPEAHIRRLEKIRPEGVAIGGVIGARHYDQELDLVGTPRLDLSVHSGGARGEGAMGSAGPGLEFIKTLDPALVREDDPHKPASVIVHAVRHADPLFRPREGGLAWADPVECLLDLHEARLESQAGEFVEALQRARKATP